MSRAQGRKRKHGKFLIITTAPEILGCGGSFLKPQPPYSTSQVTAKVSGDNAGLREEQACAAAAPGNERVALARVQRVDVTVLIVKGSVPQVLGQLECYLPLC